VAQNRYAIIVMRERERERREAVSEQLKSKLVTKLYKREKGVGFI